MEIKCPNCGRTLPEGTAFCPYCETSLVEKKPVDLPRPRSRRLAVFLVSVAAVLIAAAAILLLRHTPATYDAKGPEITYPANEGGVHLYLCLPIYDRIRPVELAEVAIPEGETWALPSMLMLDTEDGQGFWDSHVDSVTVKCVPKDGAKTMEFVQPYYSQDFPEAFLMSDVMYDTDCGVNDVVWEIIMKNGDRVILTQSIAVSVAQK